MLRALIFILLTAMFIPAQQAGDRRQPPDTPNAVAFTDADGAAVLHDFAAGLESHILRRFLATFDANSYPRFPVFAGEMDSFFGRYESFRVHYNMKQTATNADGHGVMTAEMQLEKTPLDTGDAVRQTMQVTFELARVGDKWKIVGFTPREFLS